MRNDIVEKTFRLGDLIDAFALQRDVFQSEKIQPFFAVLNLLA